jgi:hypothetical protein
MLGLLRPIYDPAVSKLTSEATTVVSNLLFYWETLVTEFKSMIESVEVALAMLVQLGKYDCPRFQKLSEMAMTLLKDIQVMFPFDFDNNGMIASLKNLKTDTDIVRYTTDYIRFMTSRMVSINTQLIAVTFEEVLRIHGRIACPSRSTGSGLLPQLIFEYEKFRKFSHVALQRFKHYQPRMPRLGDIMPNPFASPTTPQSATPQSTDESSSPVSTGGAPQRPYHMPPELPLTS